MRIVVRRGLTVPLRGEPSQKIDDKVSVTRAGFSGSDLGRARTEILVSEDQQVSAGTPLVRDRSRPDITLVAPGAGRVETITIGARRMLSSLSVSLEGEDAISFDTRHSDTAEGLTALLCQSGQWPALRSRPFERIADPARRPDSIFITATDTAPLAPDPLVVMDNRMDDLERGARALTLLTDGPVFLCQPDVAPLLPQGNRLLMAQFAGPHPAGLVGTHIARLAPPKPGSEVWHIGYQDALAIGHLLRTGQIDTGRVVSLAGPGVRNPRLVRVPMGTDIHVLARPEMTPGEKFILSGSVLGGREMPFLSRYHNQITVLERKKPRKQHWLLAALDRVATPPAFIPSQALEQTLGPDLPIVPLLRALSIGDSETAEKLGCLHLSEDDLALASYATGGEVNFGMRLRAVLDELEEAA